MSHPLCNTPISTMPEIKCTGEINTMTEPNPILKQADDLHLKILNWQADYQKKYPKASLRNVKRAAAKQFGVKLK